MTGTAPIGLSVGLTSNGLLSLTLQATVASPTLTGQINIQNGGDLQAKTYTGGSSVNYGRISVAPTAGSTASFTATNTGASDDQGTFSITITSVGTKITSGSFSSWPTAHGTFSATMPATTSNQGGTATGTTTATGTF